jgi:hypothetical protein
LKANPYFAEYIAEDTQKGWGKEYREDVGIPSRIREDARKYFAQGGLVGFGLTLLKSRDNPHAGVETLFKRK